MSTDTENPEFPYDYNRIQLNHGASANVGKEASPEMIDALNKMVELAKNSPMTNQSPQTEEVSEDKSGHPMYKGWDSIRLIGRSAERFKELIHKNWDWRSFYNGWLEGRCDMIQQNREDYDAGKFTEDKPVMKWIKYPELPEIGEVVLIKYGDGDRELGTRALIIELYENGWDNVEWLFEPQNKH